MFAIVCWLDLIVRFQQAIVCEKYNLVRIQSCINIESFMLLISQNKLIKLAKIVKIGIKIT